MSAQSYSFTFTQSEKVLRSALQARPPAGMGRVPGQRRAFALKVVQCFALVFGSVALGVLGEHLLTGQLMFVGWGSAAGMVLAYFAVFGTIFVTLPVLARRALMTRVNQGQTTVTLDASGMRTEMTHFQSHVAWAGLEGVSRSKKALVFWLGANRPSLPFSAFETPGQIDEVETAVNAWIRASR